MEWWEKKFERMVTEAAKEAFNVAVNTGCMNVYLYYRESGERTWGELRAVPEWSPTPKGFKLAINQRLPMNRTVDGIRAYIYPHCRYLMVLPMDPSYKE